MILFHILAIVLPSGNLGLGGPSKRDNHVLAAFYERMKYENNNIMCIRLTSP